MTEDRIRRIEYFIEMQLPLALHSASAAIERDKVQRPSTALEYAAREIERFWKLSE